MIPSFLWVVLDVGLCTSAWAVGGDLVSILDASVKAELVGEGIFSYCHDFYCCLAYEVN